MLPKLESTEPMQKKHLPERMEQPAPGFCKKSLFYLPKTNGGHPPIQSLDHLSLALKTEEERVAELTKREEELKNRLTTSLMSKPKKQNSTASNPNKSSSMLEGVITLQLLLLSDQILFRSKT